MRTKPCKVSLMVSIVFLMAAVSLTAAAKNAIYKDKDIRANRIVVVNNSILKQLPVKGSLTTRLESARTTYQGTVVKSIPSQGIAEWEIAGDMEKALSALNAIDGVTAFPNFVFHREEIRRGKTLEPTGTSTTTDDPYLSFQWALNNDGSFDAAAVVGADISAFDAWNVSTGGTYTVSSETSNVIVAVYDDGIDINHEDLANNIWVNPGEDLNGNGTVDDLEWNGIDDDGNGFVDDFWGWNVMYDDNSYLTSGSYHGTHVAGIIGAEGDNALGIAGVNHHIKMLSVLIWDENGETDAITIMYGYYYLSCLLKTGVKIVAVNQSWGGGGELTDRDEQRFIDVMTNYAREHDSYGTIWVCSAGNDAVNTDGLNYYAYPRLIQSPNVICVGSTDYADQVSDFSNYGLHTVDIGAPGTDILSTYPNNSYVYMSGTSMASPHVTSVIALAKSVFPNDDAHALITRVMATADVSSNFTDKWNTQGRLNAYNAVAPTATLSNYPVSANPAYIQKNFTDDYGVATVGFVNATTNTVYITNISLQGNNPSKFNIVMPTTKSMNIAVEPGGAFGVPVQFVASSTSQLTYDAVLSFVVSGTTVNIDLVGVEQGYAEMAISPYYSDLGITHFGDTLTAAFAITNTGDADLEYDLFQELIYYSDESYDLKSLVTYTPEVSTAKKTAINKGQMIREQFDKIAPYMASIERPKVTVNLNQTLGSTSDEIVAWVDSLNDSTATMANWTLASYGSGDGATENWHLVNVSGTETKDFVFLAGDFTSGYKNGTLAVAASPLFDFTPTTDGKAPLYLSFDYAAQLESGYDYFYINVIVDGERWGTILQTEYNLNNDGYTYHAVADISELVGQDNVEFWFILNCDDSYVEGFGAFFDNVAITLADAPYWADNYSGTLSPAGQAVINTTIRSGMLDTGEYYLFNYVESNALNNYYDVNIIHFNTVFGHLSIDPTESELGSFYRNQTINAGFNLINDGIADVAFYGNWYIQSSYYTKSNSQSSLFAKKQATQSVAKQDGKQIKPSERIRKVAEHYAATSKKMAKNAAQPSKLVKANLASKIFLPKTTSATGTLLSENFDTSLNIPDGWTVEDWSFGLGDIWHIENLAGLNSNVIYFGDPEDGAYYANSETYLYTPIVDISAVKDIEDLFLEFDYACYVEEGYDYFDLYIATINDDSEISWNWIASTDGDDFINDGQLHSISFNLSEMFGSELASYDKIIICWGAWSDESVSDGGILVDNVFLNTKIQDIYVTPLTGTIRVGESLPVKQQINMSYLYPGNFAMVTEFWYDYYADEYSWWDNGQVEQWSYFSVLNHQPVVVNDTLNVISGDVVGANYIINAAMENDYDEDNDYLYIWETTDPIYGAMKWTGLYEEQPLKDAVESWSYVAPLNYDGLDEIQYAVSDGFETTIGTIVFRVASIPRFVAGTQQQYTFLEDSSLTISTMRLVPGVGGVDQERYVWGKAKSDLITITVDRSTHRLTFTTKSKDQWGQASAKLYVGHTGEPEDSLNISIVVVPVNDPPTAKFAFSKTNNTVTFTDESDDIRDSEGTITEWNWDFGDGSTSTEQNPTHVYTALNTYTVTLTVTDNGQATAVTTQDVQITNIVGIAEEAALPEKFALSQNYPNPFNPNTTISYALPERSTVRLSIYNMLGKEIRTLVNHVEDAGYKSVQWDGLDQRGQLISTGIYIYKIQAGEFTQTRKMIFMK